MIINDVNSIMRWTPEWDFEWDYTMGKLEDQTGWENNVSGTGSSTLTSNAERLFAPSTNSYYRIRPLSTNPLYTLSNGIGVMQITFSGNISMTATYQGLRFALYHSDTNKFQSHITQNYFRLMTTNTSQSNPTLAPYVNNTEYTVKIEMTGSTARFYINNELKADNINVTTSLYVSHNFIMLQNVVSNQYYVDLKSVKIKNGRL